MEAVAPPVGHEGDPEKLQPEDADEPTPQEQASIFKGLGWVDRLLALWILLAMAIGIILGNFVPETGPALQKGEFVKVSVPIGNTSSIDCSYGILLIRRIAIGLLVMMYPILCRVRFEALHHLLQTRTLWTQIIFSIVVNWIIAPLLMVCAMPVKNCAVLTHASSASPGPSSPTSPNSAKG